MENNRKLSSGALPAVAKVLFCPNEAEFMIWIGFAHFRAGKTDIGLDLMNKAIQMSPDNVMFYAFLAIAYKTLGDIPNASNAIDKAIGLMPTAR